MAKKQTTAAKVRAYFKDNPATKVKDAAVALGVPAKYIHQIRWTDKHAQRRAGYKTVAAFTSVAPLKAPLPKVKDMVNHPPHYTVGGIETIDFIEAKQLPYNLGNVVKYITRAGHKGNQKQDLEKAQWYLNREIERVARS